MRVRGACALVVGKPQTRCPSEGRGKSGRAGMTTEPTGVATWSDFERVGIRVGTVRRVEPFPEARKPAYKLRIDFGPFGLKQSSAQLTALYQPDAPIGRLPMAQRALGRRLHRHQRMEQGLPLGFSQPHLDGDRALRPLQRDSRAARTGVLTPLGN